MALEEGTKAPAFALPDQDGATHRLSSYAGQWVLVYFYPKDNTPGCTKEACAIRDRLPDFRKLGIQVLGVSKDSVASHAKFAARHDLPFTLLSDESHAMIEKYGAWQRKTMAGRTYMGIVRMSYLVDPAGRIARVYPTVKPAEHADEVLADLARLI
ncbi:MAG: thioredoxin-dependent thiol peroxidase [Candidatus Krumholzibacteriota bacterium]|nr:thioredoxin-dependent thiol peroxidase [Candidatus Krumholzibacteriota bacterium]